MTTDTPATPGRLHRLVYARLLPEDARAFVAADPRTAREVWRAFGTTTLFPMGAGLVVIALGLAIGASIGAPADEVVPLAFLAGAVVTGVGATFAIGRRALLPLAIAVVLSLGAYVASVPFYAEDQALVFMALVAALAAAWMVARGAQPQSLDAALAAALEDDDARARARAFAVPASTARRIAAAAVWIVGAPLGFAVLAAFLDERSLGPVQIGVGAVAMVGGAVVSRSRKRLVVARQAGLLAFVLGVSFVASALSDNRAVDRELRMVTVLPVLVVAWLAVRSWPLRALWGALVAFVSLVAIDQLSFQAAGSAETFDDIAAVVLAALATFAMTRGLYVRPIAAAACFALLVLAGVEVPVVGHELRMGLGTFTSLGVIACLIATALIVLRDASRAARALTAAFVFLAGILFLDVPALLIGALVVVLGRHARTPPVEIAGVAGVLVAAFARLDTPWVILGDRAVAVALAAAVVFGVASSLRRLPSPH